MYTAHEAMDEAPMPNTEARFFFGSGFYLAESYRSFVSHFIYVSSFARGSSCFVTLDCLCQDQFDYLVGSLNITADSSSFVESVIIFSELVNLHCIMHACIFCDYCFLPFEVS